MFFISLDVENNTSHKYSAVNDNITETANFDKLEY